MDNQSFQRKNEITTIILLIIPIIISIIALIGWFVDNPLLNSFTTKYVPMAPNTALSFIFLSIALYLAVIGDGWKSRASSILTGIIVFISSARLTEFLAKTDLRVDDWIFQFSKEISGAFPIGKMSFPTAIAFLFLSISIMNSKQQNKEKSQILPSTMALAAFLTGISFLLGYIYQNPLLYGSTTIPMALNTAFSFTILSTAVLNLVIGRDIVQRKKAIDSLKEADRLKEERIQKLQEIEQTKNTFLSMISHELRTPLTPIRSHLDLIINKKMNEKTKKESMQTVLRNVVRLNGLINDLLDATRIQAGRLRILKEKTPITKALENAIQTIIPSAAEKNIKVTKNIEKLPELEIDRDRITQVLINIMNNAIKHSETKTMHIEAKKENEQIHISIKDTGKGINPEDFDKLFTPFYITQRKNPTQGAGLGLYVCKSIIELHGGKIWAESTPAKGTTFHFTIPEVSI